MDTSRLQDAYASFDEAAAKVADAPHPTPPDGEWNAEHILAHVAIVTAFTLRATSSIAAAEHATYDNRVSQDSRSLRQLSSVAGGSAGLRERIRIQSHALCSFVTSLTATELKIALPSRLVSNDALLVDQPVALGDLVTGLAENEIPGHALQLLALI